MNWYYVDAGQQAGPVNDAQLEILVRSGKVQADTLVWKEGMSNWQSYREANPASALPGAPPVLPAIAVAADQAVCAECGKVFNKQNMIAYGTIQVCAACKPILMQKLAEGAKLKTGLNYAGFWTRFGAVFLDWIILFAVNISLSLIFGRNFGQAMGVEPAPLTALQIVLVLIQAFIGLAYEVIMIGKFGATLGKMACKIEVVTSEGGRVSYLRAFGRYFAKALSVLICLIGFIMAGFDEEKRALHDRICDTRVVIK